MLKIGSKGENVKNLQIKLGLKPDGSFGPVTEKAVKDWQTKNGLTPDGIVGEQTWQKIMGQAVLITDQQNPLKLLNLLFLLVV